MATALVIGRAKTDCTDATFFVGIVSTLVDFIISAKSGLEDVSIRFSTAKDDAGWTESLGNAIFVGKIVYTSNNHGKTFINHEFGNLAKRKCDPETSCLFFDGADRTLNARNVLPSTTDLEGCRNIMLYLCEFIVSIDESDFETTLCKETNDFVETGDNVFGTTFIRDFELLLLSSSINFVESQNALEFYEHRFYKKVRCTLYIEEVNV